MSDLEHDPGPVPGLDALYDDRDPPPWLEDRAVAALAARRPGAAPSRGSLRRRLAAAAAAALLFAGGWGVGRAGAPGDGGALAAGYVLLLWEGPGFDPGPDPGALVAEYTAWARDARAAGVDLRGAELGPAVTVGTVDGGAAPGTRPGGFFLVDAVDGATARSLAEGHPHLGYGGWIEVAEVR